MPSEQESLPYCYSPLPSSGAFRCLILQAGLNDEPLVCSLRTGSLDSSEVYYEAISYVWGSTVKENAVLCDGAVLNITANLHEALMSFRCPDAPRTLWADSICINQDDLDEKSCQVALMGTIFRLAKRVLLHFRGHDDGHAVIVRSLTKSVKEVVDSHISALSTPIYWNSFPFNGPGDIESLFTDSRWSSLNVLLQHTYFSRAWVVQEVALANEVLPTWGKTELNWEHLMTTIIWATRRAPLSLYYSMDLDLSSAHIQCFIRRHEVLERALFPASMRSFSTFIQFLDLCRDLSVFDPRDKIYAFREIPYFDGSSRQAVQPNYRVDTLEAFRQFAERHVRQSQSLEFLDYVTHDQESHSRGTLSWVPQWQRSYEVGIPVVTGVTSAFWSKLLSRTMSVGIPKLMDATTLSGEGAIIDTVTYTSSVFGPSGQGPWFEAVVEVITGIWQAILSPETSSPYEPQHVLDALLDTVTLGVYGGTIEDWLSSRAAVSYQLLESSSSRSQASLPWMGKVRPSSPELFLTHASGRLTRNKLILTRRGYIGLAPSQTQEGDLCAIMFGCKTPCILRQAGSPSSYAYLGSSYIPGRSGRRMSNEMIYFPVLGSEASKDWNVWDDVEESYIQLC